MGAALLMLILATMPPLTDAQRQQLATARDHAADWDEPALYPLLGNVAEWSADQSVDAMAPDYDVLHRVPEGHRGEVFLIDGLLGGPPQIVKRALSRPGPWDDNLQQWSVLVRRDPDEVAVVLLIDPMPPGRMPTRGGAHVRIAARFFKVWQFVDRDGQPTPYLMFVGRTVEVDAGATSTPAGGSASNRMLPAMLVFVAALAGWFMMRRVTRATSRLRRSAPRRQRDDVTPADGLPDDPADALRAMEQRHDQRSDIE
jgi:HAMP domain-containing protein